MLGLGNSLIRQQPPSTADTTSFISTWETAGASEANRTVTLPLVSSGSINFTIDWGDSTAEETITAYDDADRIHIYAAEDTYTVTMAGTIKGFKMNNDANNKTKLKTITQWGTFDISTPDAFKGCTALNVSATDAPTISSTDMNETFNSCTSLTSIGGDWDVSSVQNMSGMFSSATVFNQDISSWDVSAVTNMSEMFYNAEAFNQPLAAWGSKTSNVTVMNKMFQHAFAFDQPIGAWNVSKVTNFAELFQGVWNNQTIFNQDLSDWDTAAATAMNSMFLYSGSFTGDGVSSFDIAEVTTMARMLEGANALTTANYDALLIAWEGQTEQADVSFHAGDAVMTTGGDAEAARDALVANGWTIIDSTGTHT